MIIEYIISAIILAGFAVIGYGIFETTKLEVE